MNDAVLGIVSMSLKQYLRQNNDFDCKSMNLLVPFSLRELPEGLGDHRIENDFSILCFTLQLHSVFNEAITQIANQTRALKNSLYPHATLHLTQIIAWFPGIVG